MLKYKSRLQSLKCDPFSAAAAGIGALANIAGTVISGYMGRKTQEEQNEFNAEQAAINRDYQTAEREAAQQFNIDMWNMNNAYNSPAAQLQRLKEAGISPAAMMGGHVQPFTPTAVTTNPQFGSQASTDSGALASTILNSGANIGKTTADMLKSLSEARATDYQTRYNKKTEAQRIELLDSELNKNKAQIEQWLADKGLKDVTADQLREVNRYIGQYKVAEIREKLAHINNMEQDSKLKAAEVALTNEKVITEGAQRDLIGSQQNVLDQQAKSEEQRYLQLKQETEFSKALGMPMDAPATAVMFRMKQQGCLDEYIENMITKPERAKWKPKDFQEEQKEVGVKAGIFGTWSIFGRGRDRGKKSKPYNSHGYDPTKSVRTPTTDELNFTD